MSDPTYRIGDLTREQLDALQGAVSHAKVDLQDVIASNIQRAAKAREAGDGELALMAEDALRVDRERLSKLESVAPLVYGAQSATERRFARVASARRTARYRAAAPRKANR